MTNRRSCFLALHVLLIVVSLLIVVVFGTNNNSDVSAPTRVILQRKREQLNDVLVVFNESERIIHAIDKVRNKEQFQSHSTQVTLLMKEKHEKVKRMKNLIESLQLEIALLEYKCEMYMGDSCDIPICFNISSNSSHVCNGRGNCIDIDMCSCQDGYHGMNCSEYSCYNIISNDYNNTCSGNGQCIDRNTCQCFQGFDGNNCQFILPPKLVTSTHNSISLKLYNYMEYRMNNGEWQSINIFLNLNYSSIYSFQQRTINNHLLVSEHVEFKTEKANQTTPSAPTLASRSATSITLTPDSTMEFRRMDSNGAWQHSNIFTGLSAGTSYSFQRRIRETTTHHASPSSVSVTFTTEKLSQTAPTAPTMASRTTTSITLTPDSTMEFRRGSGTWQTSNVFSGLTVGTSYTFTRRIRETTTHHASSESVSATIRTEKLSQTAPTAPTLLCQTSATIRLTEDLTMEYRRIGSSEWQESNLFTNLSPSTSYSFRRRIRETITHEPSPESDSISITTRAGPVSIVPELHSDNSHGMVASASSFYYYSSSLIFYPYKAFVPVICDPADMWYSAPNTNEISNGWVQIDLGANNLHRITGYAVTNSPSNTHTRIRTFRLMGSNDGYEWTTLHDGSSPGEGRYSFTLSNTNSWRFIRLQSLSTNNVNPWTAVPYLEIFGTKV